MRFDSTISGSQSIICHSGHYCLRWPRCCHLSVGANALLCPFMQESNTFVALIVCSSDRFLMQLSTAIHSYAILYPEKRGRNCGQVDDFDLRRGPTGGILYHGQILYANVRYHASCASQLIPHNIILISLLRQ